MKVNYKKLHVNAVEPTYADNGAVGLDMVAVDRKITDKYVEYDTGIAVEIPEGYYGDVAPRSSISNYDLVLANSIGKIDSSFRNSIKFRFKVIDNGSPNIKMYDVGDRIGQLIILPYPKIELEEVDELSETERGMGGFGSTGK